MYEDIRDKSLFDFCDDPEMPNNYTGGYADKDEYLESLSKMQKWEADAYRVLAICYYAEDTENREMLKAVKDQCDDILDRFYNEKTPTEVRLSCN